MRQSTGRSFRQPPRKARRVGASPFESRRRFRPPRQIAGLDERTTQLPHHVDRLVGPSSEVGQIPIRDAAEMRDSTLLGLLGRRHQHRLDRRSCGAGDMGAQPVGVRRSLPRLRRVDHRVYPGIGVVFEHDRHVADMPPRIRRCVLLAFTRVESEVLAEESLGRFELIGGLQSFPISMS